MLKLDLTRGEEETYEPHNFIAQYQRKRKRKKEKALAFLYNRLRQGRIRRRTEEDTDQVIN